MKAHTSQNLLLLIFFCLICFTNLFAESKKGVQCYWNRPSGRQVIGNESKDVPIRIENSFTKLAPAGGKERFEMKVTFILNQSDSLFKPGDRYVVGHLYEAGTTDHGDSIEYVSPEYALLDADNTQATFTIRISKGWEVAFYNWIFGGGHIVKKSIPSQFKSAVFHTDHAINVDISFELLHEGVTGKLEDKPQTLPYNELRMNSVDTKDEPKNDRSFYPIF